MDQPLTRRQRRLLKKQEQERLQSGTASKRTHTRRLVGLLVIIILVGVAVYGIRRIDTTAPATTYTNEPVHWHAAFEVELCGKKQDFSSYGATSHAGSPLFHTHGDSMMHIEGRIIQKEDIALGKFFDLLDIPFGSDRIMDKKNGDVCPSSSLGTGGKPGQVKMFVNDVPNNEFRDYIPKPTENGSDQRIRIVFE